MTVRERGWKEDGEERKGDTLSSSEKKSQGLRKEQIRKRKEVE